MKVGILRNGTLYARLEKATMEVACKYRIPKNLMEELNV